MFCEDKDSTPVVLLKVLVILPNVVELLLFVKASTSCPLTKLLMVTDPLANVGLSASDTVMVLVMAAGAAFSV